MRKKAHKIEIELTSADVLKDAHLLISSINSVYSDIPPLGTDEVIERGLLLTKIEPSYQEIAKALIYFKIRELVSGSIENYSVEGLARRTEFMRDWWAGCESERKSFLSRLNELMQSPDKARAKHMAADLRSLRKELLITCDMDDQGNVVKRLFPMTVEAGYKYVLQALYHADHKRWKRLRKCGHCQSIFIRKISDFGGRPRDYCTPECQKKSDQKKALIRQRKARQRKSK